MRPLVYLYCVILFCGCMRDYNTGIQKLNNSDLTGATENFTLALQKDPKNDRIFFARAMSRGFSDQYTGAINDLTRAIKIQPNDPDYYFYRGFFKSKMGNEKGAIIDYSKTIQIYPYYREAYYNRGIKWLNTGYLSEACQDFQQAIALGDTLSIRYKNVYCRRELAEPIENK